MERKGRPKLVKTPKFKIPLGEAIKKPDGRYCLMVKKAKGQEIEEVPLDQLNLMIMNEAEKV